VFFLFVGVLHFIVPPNLPAMFSWMHKMSPALHRISGTADILGGLGLILPAVTHIQNHLLPIAAAGLALVMVAAMIYHIPRGEIFIIFPTILRPGAHHQTCPLQSDCPPSLTHQCSFLPHPH
jgi:uncharacterized membrane protein